jgi:hypothetical protein
MSLDSANTRVAVTGAVYVADTGAAAPTSAVAAVGGSGYTDLGYLNEDGVTETINRTTDEKKAWQNAATVREDVTDGSYQVSFTMIETKKEVLELYYGQALVAGVLDVEPGALGARQSFIIDYVDTDSGKVERTWIPEGQVTELTERNAVSGELLGYGVTIKAYGSAELDGKPARKFWSALGAS